MFTPISYSKTVYLQAGVTFKSLFANARDGTVSLLEEEMLIIFEERAYLDTKKIKWQILQSVVRDVSL